MVVHDRPGSLPGGYLRAWFGTHCVQYPICRVTGFRLHRKRHVLVQLATCIIQPTFMLSLSLDQSRFLLFYWYGTCIRSNRSIPFLHKPGPQFPLVSRAISDGRLVAACRLSFPRSNSGLAFWRHAKWPPAKAIRSVYRLSCASSCMCVMARYTPNSMAWAHMRSRRAKMVVRVPFSAPLSQIRIGLTSFI